MYNLFKENFIEQNLLKSFKICQAHTIIKVHTKRYWVVKDI